MGLLKRIRDGGQPEVQPQEQPLSVSGRGHVNGFLNLEELNVDLQGRQGLEIFDRMYWTDGDCHQVLNMLANPIAAGTWEVEPAGGPNATPDQQEDARFIRWALFENMTPNMRGHLIELLPVLFRSGFAPFEKVWGVADFEGKSVTVIRSLQLRLPRTIYRWKQDAWNNLQAIEQYLPVPRAQVIAGPNTALPGDPVLSGPSNDQTLRDDGSITDPGLPTNTAADVTDTRQSMYRQTVWLPMQNLVYYRVGPEGDNWEGRSLMRPAYKHWLMKDAIERMDAIAQEKEALGIPVCYPPLGATPDQFEAMETILNGIRANTQGYILMPGPKAAGTSSGQGFGQGWLLEYLKPGEHGSGRDPHPSLAYHTDKIAASLVAEFIRVGHSLTGGTRSVAETQMDPFLVGVESVAGLIEDCLNEQVVAPLMAYNRPDAHTVPRLKMSLVDATTLSQLADFVLKLVQVGAMIPDQTLEDFLRRRADLPPAAATDVNDREGLDASLRREILMGKNGGGGAPTGTNGPAGSTTGGSAGGAKGVDNKDKPSKSAAQPAPAKPPEPATAHEALTKKALKDAKGKTLSAEDYLGPDAPPYQPGSQRIRWRPQAFYELNVDLDGIEDHFDSAPDRLHQLCGGTMTSLARQMADEYPKRIATHPQVEAHVAHVLDDAYQYGAQTVSSEIDKHAQDQGYALSAFTAPSRAGIKERAHHAASQVVDEMHHSVAHMHMQGHDVARQQRAAEKAGAAALKRVARTHVAAAFNQGREDRILDAANADNGVTWGVRYTAILDSNTCDHCSDADDGVVRALDDPVRLARKPPNPDCESLHSGRGNQCRCFEIPEPMEGA